MRDFGELKNMLCKELDEITHEPLNSGNLDAIYKMVDVVKDIATINAMEEEYPEEGYSRRAYRDRPIYAYDDGSYGRGRYAKRDSMGRYSSEGRSYDYSGDTKEELRRLMDTAQTDHEKEAIRKALDSMR